MEDKKYVIVFYKAYDVEAQNKNEAKLLAEAELNAYLHDYIRPSDGLTITIKRR